MPALRLDLNIVYSDLLKPFRESTNLNCHNISLRQNLDVMKINRNYRNTVSWT